MEQKIAKQKQMNVFQRVLEDKAAIRRSIQKGDDLKEVAKQRGIRFATPLWCDRGAGADLLFHYAAWYSLSCLFYWFFLLSLGFQACLYVQHRARKCTPHPIGRRIALTVVSILHRFFKRNVNAMIMVCDNLDGKELIRERLFSRWYMRYNDGSVRKCDASLETDGYSLFVSLYMRFDNPNAQQLVAAFYDLVKNNFIPTWVWYKNNPLEVRIL